MAQGDYCELSTINVENCKKLIKVLVRHHGSVSNAKKAIGLSDHSYARLMNDDAIVKVVAAKIKRAYEALCKQKHEK